MKQWSWMCGVLLAFPALVQAAETSTASTPARNTVTSASPGVRETQAGASAASVAPGAMGYDFGDFSSKTLMGKSWEALAKSDYAAVEAYTKKCIDLYQTKATEQAAGLTDVPPAARAFDYWALNDVGTAYFISAQAHLAQGRVKEAKDAFNIIIERFPYAQAWDQSNGAFWKVASAANDKLSTIGTAYDFGDYTSQTLVVKAWQALGKNDHRGVELFTKKCIELYEAEAKAQQAKLSDFAPKDKAFDSWALNDVATAFFILGESLLAQQRPKEARAAYERVLNDFSFAQCWDTAGWFWKVAVAARGKINKIMAMSGGA